MKSFYTFISGFVLLLFASITVGFGQGTGCSGQFTLEYPSGSGTTGPIPFNNGTGDVAVAYCPTASRVVNVTVTSASIGTFIFSGSNYTESHRFTAAEVTANTPYNFTLPATSTNSTFTLNTSIECQNPKNSTLTFNLAPSLKLVSSTPSGSNAVCPGAPVTLTATGAINTSTPYILSANGVEIERRTDGMFTVTPTSTTNYTVSTTTATCANNSAVQTISVIKDNLTLSSTATSITSSQPVTITAGGGQANSTYTFTVDNKPFATNTTGQIADTPTRSVTYYVTGTTASGCPSTASIAILVNGKPLPVELTSFEAVRNNKVAVLTWATASEKNSAYFEIERSFDGKNFESVGQRAGAGTTSARTNYQFIDTRLTQSSSTVYYRLRQVDVTGETNYSPVRALQAAKAGAIKAEVFPNPFDKSVAVQFYSLGTEAVTLTVRNVLGQTVLTQTATTAEGVQEIKMLETASLSRGMYYLTIRQGNQQQVVRISRQ